MGTDPAPFWVNFLLFKSKNIKQLISNRPSETYKYHGFSRFIDNFCAINDGNEFLPSFKNVYLKELELKMEHQGNHASFSYLDIKIEDSFFVYKFLAKEVHFQPL